MFNLNNKYNWQPLIPLAVLILFWQFLSMSGLIPGYMLPGPARVTAAFIADFSLLLWRTLLEAMAGLSTGQPWGLTSLRLLYYS